MAHGTPDWGLTAGTITTYQLTDLAELAARLGSIVTFDRRGEVLFLDDFADGLVHWSWETDGAGASVDLSAARARIGRFSARLVGGSDGWRYAEIFRSLSPHAPSNCGFEVAFNYDDDLTFIRLTLIVYDGATRAEFGVIWYNTSKELLYTGFEGDDVLLAAGIDLNRGPTPFHTAKLVTNVPNGEYIRFLLDNAEYSLAGIPGLSEASALAPDIELVVAVQSKPGVNGAAYIDAVIATQNEPVCA